MHTLYTRTARLLLIFMITIVLSMWSLAPVQATDHVDIDVNATVGAQPTDFQAQLSQLTPGETFGHDNTIDYALTYTSHLSYSANITVQASWSKGTIAGNNIATEDILDYVNGSAKSAYNNTPPVVDLQNRTITWTISDFPGNTSGTVIFQLKTTNHYRADKLVLATVTGRVLGPGTQSLDSSKTIIYKNDYVPPSRPTTSTTSSPTLTPTSSPTQQSAAFYIGSVQLKTISSGQATIETTLSKPAKITLQYGTSLRSLTKSITTLQTNRIQDITIDNLQPATVYYFRIIAINGTGQRLTSDIFTFTTAQISQPPHVVNDSIIVSALDNVIFDPRLYSGITTAVIGQNNEYKVTLKTTEPTLVSSLEVYLANPNVLGISNIPSRTYNIQSTELAKVASGVFSGTLQAPSTPSSTIVIARISDTNGNIVEEPLFTLKTVQNLTVLSQTTNKPIEAAAIYLSRYDPNNQLYTPLLPQVYSTQNPAYTESNGQVFLPLPPGTYRAEITAIGFGKKTVEFTVGDQPGQEFPVVNLSPAPFSLFTIAEYYGSIFFDTSNTATTFIHTLVASNRFLSFFSIITLLGVLLLLIYALSLRLHIAIRHLPSYLIYHLKTLFIPPLTHQLVISGQLIDVTSGDGIANAVIHLRKAHGHTVLAHTTTNSLGEFYLTLHHPLDIVIDAGKDGYRRFQSSSIEADDLSHFLNFEMKPNTKPIQNFLTIYLWHLQQLVKDSAEVLIILSLIMEILTGLFFDWLAVLPHFIISLASFLLWLSYMKKNLHLAKSLPTA